MRTRSTLMCTIRFIQSIASCLMKSTAQSTWMLSALKPMQSIFHLTAAPTACIASNAAYSSAALLGVEGFSSRAAELIFLNSVRSTSRYAKNSSDWPPKCIAARSASKIACCWIFAVHSAGDAGLSACCQTHHRVRQ